MDRGQISTMNKNVRTLDIKQDMKLFDQPA
jgi:hypothetical protein